jgi:hypothetical protein
MQVKVKPRPDYRQRGSVEITIRRILTIQDIQAKREKKATLPDDTLPITYTQQQAGSIGGLRGGPPSRSHIFCIIIDKIVFWLRLEEQERKRPDPPKNPASIIKAPIPGIVIIIRVRPLGTVIYIHYDPRIQPLVQGISDLGSSPYIKIIGSIPKA